MITNPEGSASSDKIGLDFIYLMNEMKIIKMMSFLFYKI